MMLEVLSANRNLQGIVSEEVTMLSQTKLSDLPSYRQGVQQGMQQGERDLLLRQLDRRFAGQVTEAHRTRIRGADSETLLLWGERIFDADSPDAVFDAH